MKICEICGNDIEDEVSKCPYCKSFLAASTPRRKKRAQRLTTVNLKSDLPTAAEAVRRLAVRLETARSGGTKIVRIIHGWGSTGSGGKIKKATHKYLIRLERQGQIKGFHPGEDYSELSDRARDLMIAHPVLKDSLRSDRLNRGITLVDL
ncbi:MAG: Smr/MutS family protein [Candidatus Eisenbacteria bacterium]